MKEARGEESVSAERGASASEPSRSPFDQLLALLDPDRERAGHVYELLRRRLVTFFRARGSLTPEDYADRVLDRLARKFSEAEGLVIKDLIGYAIGTARMIWLEAARAEERERLALAELGRAGVEYANEQPDESLLECFESCLKQLPNESRELIVDYYRDSGSDRIERRKRTAVRLGIPTSALRLRAHRLRARLEECIEGCADGNAEENGVRGETER